MNAPQIIFVILLLVGLVAPRKLQIYLLFLSQPFSAMALVPPEWLSGTSITPGSVAAFLFILRSSMNLTTLKDALGSLLSINRLGWLGAFFIVALAGAVILPQMFNGDIIVYGLRQPFMSPVAPSVTNFTQAGYLFISIFVTALLSSYLRRSPEFSETLLKGILIGGCTIVATGFVDIIANMSGNAAVLKMFYTADYGYSAGEILGARRVLGLTPEPSAFGSLAVYFAALLLFLRPAYPSQLWRWKVPVVGWGCVVMAFLSTSSAAYVCAFVLIGIYLFYSARSLSKAGTIVRNTMTGKALWAVIIGSVFFFIILFSEDPVDYVMNLIDTLIFQKHMTASYIERSSWTSVGLGAFWESYGLGVGVGSVRTSNFFANILASTGAIGTLLFFLFLFNLFQKKPVDKNSRSDAIAKASKLALIPMLAGLFLVGTTPDFGIGPATAFALIIGVTAAESKVWHSPLLARAQA